MPLWAHFYVAGSLSEKISWTKIVMKSDKHDSCIWYSCVRASLIWFFNYNQQDAAISDYLFPKGSTCFGRFLRPSSGAHNCTLSFWYCQPLLLQIGIMAHPRYQPATNTAAGWYRGSAAISTCNQYCCRLVSWLSHDINLQTKLLQVGIVAQPQYQPAAVLVDNTWSWVYRYVLLMMSGGTARNTYSLLEINKQK